MVFHQSPRSGYCKSDVWCPLLFACRKWKPGQPDNWGYGHEIGEDCAGLIHEGLWNDFLCDDLISYICETENETCMYISGLIYPIYASSFSFMSATVFFQLKYLKDIFPRGVLMSFCSFFCSEIVWIVAMSWKRASSEQLDFTHVVLVQWHSTWKVHMERAKGQIWKWAQGCSSKLLSSAKEMHFSSEMKPVQLFQQVQYSRTTKGGESVFLFF